ncbi:tetratricopeptide repeat protein [Leucobacter iarius]|uniref:Tetratricopeptide repeat protein n=1 Tax=Leucobacter iarius TaxID=333963 RepID=A0ABN2LPF5_9MICO
MSDEERERLADDLAEAQSGAERGDLERTKRAIDELRILLPRVVAVFGAASEAHRSAISSLATALNRIDETERSRELFEALGELVNDAIREVGGEPETLDEGAFEEYLSAHGLAAVVGASAETASRDLDALETLAGQAERRLGPSHPLTLWMLSLRAQQRARFDGADGLEAFDMLIARALAHGDGSLLHLRAIADKATALSRLDFDAESAQLWRRVLEGRRIELGLEDPDTLDAWFWLARTLAWSEDAVEAADELDRLIPAMERALGRDADDTLEGLRFRVRVLRRLADDGDDPRSSPEHLLGLLREILGRETVLLGPDAETPLRTRFEIIELLRENGQTEDALTAATAVREDAVRALGRTAVPAVEAGLREQRLLRAHLDGAAADPATPGDARDRAVLLAEELCDAAEDACRDAVQRSAARDELRIRGRALAEAWIIRAEWFPERSQEAADLFEAGAARIDALGIPFRVDAIRLYDRLAGMLISIERPADALPPAERSLQLEQDEYARLAAGDPDPAGEAELRGSATRIAQSLENVGIALRRMGRAVEAEPRLRSGIAEAVAAGASPGALDDLRTLHALALQELDRFDEAAAELREIAERSGDPRRAIDLAVVYLNADRPREVETLLNPVRARLEQEGRLETPTGLSVLGNLALAVCQLDRHAEAIAQWDRLYELQVRVLGALNRDTLKTLNNRALEELHLGRYAESAHRFERVVEQRTEALGPRSPETLGALANLARAVRLSGDLVRGKQLSERVVAESREVLGEAHPETLGRIRELDRVLDELGRSSDGSAGAEALAAERRELAEGVTAALAADAADADPADPHAVGVRALRYADHLRSMDRVADALVEYTRARDGLAGDPGLDWLAAERGIADCHRRMQAYREAADSYARLVPQIERLLPQEPWALADALDQQSFALAQLNRVDELVPPQERAIAIAEQQGDRPEQEIKYRTWLGRRLSGRGQHGLALEVYRAAAERSEALLGERHRLTLDLFDDVAEALIATGQDREALRVYRRNLPRMMKELGANAKPVKRAIASRDAAAKRASRPVSITIGVVAAVTIIVVAILNLPH